MHLSRLGAVVGSLLLLTACAEPTAGAGTASNTSSAAPSPTPSPERDPVEAALADLDRREQVARLVVVAVALTDLSPADTFFVEGVGGLFLPPPPARAACRPQSWPPSPTTWARP